MSAASHMGSAINESTTIDESMAIDMSTAINGVLVTINVPPALEEAVVDWLLARDSVTGFTSYRAYGHASAHEHLSIAEQVSGRQRRLEFRVSMAALALDVFLSDLADQFSGADVFFVATPVLRSAHLGTAPGRASQLTE